MSQTTLPEQQECCSETSAQRSPTVVNEKVRLETTVTGQIQPGAKDDTLEVSNSGLSFRTADQDLAAYLGIVRDAQMNQRVGRTYDQQVRLDRQEQWWLPQGDDTSGGDQPFDQEGFHRNFYSNIREAYYSEGNSPAFWGTLQKLMDQDLQQMVDAGRMTPEDREAFNKVFMNTVRDVYKTDGAGNPMVFWNKLENRLISDIQKERELPKPPNPDDGGDNPNPDPNQPTDGSVKDARDRLHKSMEGVMSGDRLTRFDNMMKEFEKHGAERVEQLVAAGKDRATVEKEWNEKIKKTYDALNEMVGTNPSSAVWDKDTRGKLAENAMYLFMNPSRENQGAHGTCWIESVINLVGLNNHPDEMARLLKEVALTGTYKDHDVNKYTIPRDLLQFPGEEKDWTISNAGNGARSPVGAIFDRTISFLEGRRDGGTNGGTPSEAQELIRRVTGDKAMAIVQIRDNYLTDGDISRILSPSYKQAMLEQGGVILLGPGHMFAATMSKENGQWQIHGDNQWGDRNEQLIGVVQDIGSWRVQQTRSLYKPDDPNLRISSDTPIGYRGYNSSSNGYYSSYGPYGFSYNYSARQYTTEAVMPRGKDQQTVYDDTNPLIAVGGPRGRGDDDESGHTPIRIHGRRTVRHFNEDKYRDTMEKMDRIRTRLQTSR